MQLGSRFQEYSVQKAGQLASRAKPQYEAYLHVAQQHAKTLDAAVAELESKADATHKQKADGEAFRGTFQQTVTSRLAVCVMPDMCLARLACCGHCKAGHLLSLHLLFFPILIM